MRLKLFLLLALFATLPLLAQRAGVQGVVVDAKTGQPVVGATVLLDNQGDAATTGTDGAFIIDDAWTGNDVLLVLAYGYKDWSREVFIMADVVENVGTIQIEPVSFESSEALEFRSAVADLALTESQLEDEEGNTQEIALLSSASDNPFYQAASYNFSTARFRIRGYETQKNETYINGIPFNDGVRFAFNYSMTGGLNQAFKNKTVGLGLEENAYGFGGIGGATNIKTFAADYAPGTRLSLAYTNGNYRWRGMVTHCTGLNKHGWAMTLSAVARYADEGVYPGSFYNSWGYFLAIQKVFNPQHSLSLTTFGAPTKRAANSAIFEEAGQLINNMYNPDWGWQDGKKRNARVVESFDPTAILNWLWKPADGTTLNTGFAYHKSFYSKAAINRISAAADPRPDYYRYMPSYFTDETSRQMYTDLWTSESEITQIRWDDLYNINYMNNYLADQTGVERGSSYILEKRHSNQSSFTLSSILNKRFSNQLTMQTGANANYTVSSYYKTIKDLMGGRYWLDVDVFSERDFPDDRAKAQNDLDNPNRKVGKGDRFGYDYDLLTFKAQLWHQWVLNLAKWELFASVKGDYFQFQRDGHMRNGRAPEDSYGKGATHRYLTYGAKGGVIFKLDGRNSFVGHAFYGTEAPRPYDAYISQRVKDDVISDLKVEKIFSADLGYLMNYRNFKSAVTVFFTDQRDNTERTSFYDDVRSTFMNYALTGIHKQYKGVEVGVSYKLSPSLTVSGAANIARYQYKNNPYGTRSYENGAEADVTNQIFIKNYYVSGTPQECYSLAFNWSGPKMWFFELNGAWMNRSYVSMSPARHEPMADLFFMADNPEELSKLISDLGTQEKLNEALIINASIGHVIYLSRSASLNLNLNLNNILDNRNIQTGGYQQNRIDTKDLMNTANKFPNKYYYAQGFKMFLNVGLKF